LFNISHVKKLGTERINYINLTLTLLKIVIIKYFIIASSNFIYFAHMSILVAKVMLFIVSFQVVCI